IETCDAFRRDDRVALRDQANAGAEKDFRSGSGGKRQRNERVVRMGIAFGQLSATGKRGAAGHWDMRVLRQKQRLEAALFGSAGQLADVDAIVGREVANTNAHWGSPDTARSSLTNCALS